MAVSESILVPVVAFASKHYLLTIILSPLILLTLRSLYRLSPLHPLYSVPGPYSAKLTSSWLNYHAYIGDECTAVHALHRKYGSILRTGPNSVDISDGSALHQVYVEKGGFLKPDFYSNFDIDGHRSIFSALDPGHRAPRAKVVAALFSTASLRSGAEDIATAVDGFVRRMKRESERAKDSRGTIDMLEICRGLAIDTVTGYLFGIRYGGCDEDEVKEPKPNSQSEEESMTASAMVDSFVAVGKFWYLPPWAFQLYDRINTALWPDKQTERSMARVDDFVAKVVEQAQTEKESGSYPARLLQAGFSVSEARAQCKDLIFAGTDSTAMNLATICFLLAQNPETYQFLRQEISASNPTDEELQSLPYLRGVIREGLRLSMANPSRLPRVVPPSGWTFKQTHLPAGTIVSCSPYELHLNPSVYINPQKFDPDRWITQNKPSEEMNRDHIAFGLGSRQCIARNLATVELFKAVSRIAEMDLLAGLKCVKDRIDIVEWFNSHVVGGKIELTFGSEH